MIAWGEVKWLAIGMTLQIAAFGCADDSGSKGITDGTSARREAGGAKGDGTNSAGETDGSSTTCPTLNSGATEAVEVEIGSRRIGSTDTSYEQLTTRRAGQFLHAPCGTIGMLYRDVSVETDPSTWALTYREVADGVVGPAQKVRSGTKTDFPKLFVWSLVFDDACRPVVMWSSGAQGYRQYTPGSPHWTSVEVP